MTEAIRFDNSYAERLPGFYVDWKAATVPAPKLLRFNQGLAQQLGLDFSGLDEGALAHLFSGNSVPAGARPLAQAYAGHQFGGFSPQLGDGRALLIGEVITPEGERRDIQLKGSGRTPFSRGGDGKAAIGPVLREYIIGETMHALGIPTTRALAAVATGETIMRETPLPGAVLTRVASSHVRVGTFQFFAARGQEDAVRQLADYVIWRHYPDLAGAGDPYLALLDAVAGRQARLLAQWMATGFIHGVMNTDNMAISGETIDYGPCAFMDRYDPATVFSSIDHHGRYAYANQPKLAAWNLARFAETLLPLIDADADKAIGKATGVIEGFAARYRAHWVGIMRGKLGLASEEDEDGALADGFLDMLHGANADYTLAFRGLSRAANGGDNALADIAGDNGQKSAWLDRWLARLAREQVRTADERAAAMDRANPLYIPRNHKVEEALAAANYGDLSLFERLLDVLSDPWTEREGLSDYTRPAPADAPAYVTFCGT